VLDNAVVCWSQRAGEQQGKTTKKIGPGQRPDYSCSVVQQIFNPEFLFLQAMPAVALALGFTAIIITFFDKTRRMRRSEAERRA
jgi:hypothetical protein